jgi:hypothetical protein
MKSRNIVSTTILLALCFLALCQIAQAVSPAPDGGYPGANTAEGQSALLSLTTGTYNTAVGILSLKSDTTGSYNTAVGAGTLVLNTGDQNTAIGFGALLSNTTGFKNTANGAFALFSNTIGIQNTASGYSALFSNTTGGSNTANGIVALVSNTTGGLNTATGLAALASNTTGSDNTANGEGSLQNNTAGASNTALGNFAGSNVTTANNVICIGANVAGNNVDNSCYIGNIFGATSSNGIGVLVNSNGRLGTTTSSRRFKEGIKPMNQASEALFSLKPVTFRYKKEIDPAGTSQFGLVAEDVEKVSPDLVVRDKERKPYSVRYDLVNAMLLNEFLKEHKIVEELKSTVQKQEAVIAEQQQSLESKLAEQEKRVEALTSGLQRVSAQLEVSRSTSQMAWLPVVALGECGGNQ